MYDLIQYIVFSKHGTKILFPILCLLIPSYNTYKILECKYSNNYWSKSQITISLDNIKPILTYWILISGVYSLEMLTNNVIIELPFYDELKLVIFLGLQTRNNTLSIKTYNNYIQPFIKKNKENIESITKKIFKLITRQPELKTEYTSEDEEYYLNNIVKKII